MLLFRLQGGRFDGERWDSPNASPPISVGTGAPNWIKLGPVHIAHLHWKTATFCSFQGTEYPAVL